MPIEPMKMRQFRSTDSAMNRWRKIRLPLGQPSDFSSVCRFALDRLFEQLVGPLAENPGPVLRPCRDCGKDTAIPDLDGNCPTCAIRLFTGGRVTTADKIPVPPKKQPKGNLSPAKGSPAKEPAKARKGGKKVTA